MRKKRQQGCRQQQTAGGHEWLIWFLVALLCVTLVGCSEWGYYRQAAVGQWQLLRQRQDIDALIAAQSTPKGLKEQLELVSAIRDFASAELLLPDNRSYRTYVDLGRSHVVWNVVATPALSLDPLTWCFPIAGCVPYRGYFDLAAAQRFAHHLQERGDDVHVYGVAAYSTLSWFDDPVLNTFIHYPEAHLAGLIFHELAHQKLYIKDDGTFNESFAQAIETLGVERWLRSRNQVGQLEEYERYRFRHQEFIDLILKTRQQLDELYRSETTEASQLTAKEDLLLQFRHQYGQLKQQWGGDNRFDAWVERPLNNSHFALIATYQTYVPAFHSLLAQQGDDLQLFYQVVANLASQPPEARIKFLQSHLP